MAIDAGPLLRGLLPDDGQAMTVLPAAPSGIVLAVLLVGLLLVLLLHPPRS